MFFRNFGMLLAGVSVLYTCFSDDRLTSGVALIMAAIFACTHEIIREIKQGRS